MARKPKLPMWAVKNDELRKLARVTGVELFHGNTVQVIFRDYSDPIGSGFLRPLSLTRDGRTVMSMFSLEDQTRHEYIMAPWYIYLKSYVIDLPPEFLPLVRHNPAVSYIEGDARNVLKARIASIERKEPWAKPVNTSSTQESDSWESILSPRGRRSLAPSRSWLPPALEQVNKSPLVRTV